jgi:hypothetical protein
LECICNSGEKKKRNKKLSREIDSLQEDEGKERCKDAFAFAFSVSICLMGRKNTNANNKTNKNSHSRERKKQKYSP